MTPILVEQGNPQVVVLHAGLVLRITAPAGTTGRIHTLDGPGSMTLVWSGEMKLVGPFDRAKRYQVETLSGEPMECSTAPGSIQPVPPLEVDDLPHRTDDKRETRMPKGLKMPKLAGIAGAFAKLQEGIEHRAEKLMHRIATADVRADNVFGKAHSHMDATEGSVKEVESFLDGLDATVSGDNGSPLVPDSK